MTDVRRGNGKRQVPTTPMAHEYMIRRERIAAQIVAIEWRLEKVESNLKRLAKKIEGLLCSWENSNQNGTDPGPARSE
jgi:hypothetical protein